MAAAAAAAGAAADSRQLLSRLPPDTAASVLGWLTSRGRDLPVHIPLKTIRFARECFTLIDVDGSGTLEPEELLAVFRALGQEASLRQVIRLVESVAGPGARHLKFTDFAQMMHGAMSSRRREEQELRDLMQQEVNLEGSSSSGSGSGSGSGAGRLGFGASSSTGRARDRGGRGGGGGGPGSKAVVSGGGPPPQQQLNWTDFHLLAKAFRRRVIIDGVISNAAGWRDKVTALAERQAVTSRAATGTAASVWRHRLLKLKEKEAAAAAAAGAGAAGSGAGSAAPGMALVVAAEGGATGAGAGAGAGGGEQELLGGAISAGPTPREGNADIRIDCDSEQPVGASRQPPAAASGAGLAPGRTGSSLAARLQQQAQQPQRQMSPIVQQLLTRLRSNAAGMEGAASSTAAPEGHGSSRPGASPAASGPALPAASASGPALPATAEPGSAAAVSATNVAACASVAAAADFSPAATGASTFASHAEGGGDRQPTPHPLPAQPAADGSGMASAQAGYDWRRSAARMHMAAAASRQAATDAGPSCRILMPSPVAAMAAATSSRLLAHTASSRARVGPVGVSIKGGSRRGVQVQVQAGAASAGSGASRGGSSFSSSSSRQGLQGQTSRPASQGQRTRLAAVALIKGGGQSLSQ